MTRYTAIILILLGLVVGALLSIGSSMPTCKPHTYPSGYVVSKCR